MCVCVWHRGEIHVDSGPQVFKGKHRRALCCGEAHSGSRHKIHQCQLINHLHRSRLQILGWITSGVEQLRMQSKYSNWISPMRDMLPKLHFTIKSVIFQGWGQYHTFSHPVLLQPPHVLWELFLCHSQPRRSITHCWAFCDLWREPCGRVLRGGTLCDLSLGGCVGPTERHPRHS